MTNETHNMNARVEKNTLRVTRTEPETFCGEVVVAEYALTGQNADTVLVTNVEEKLMLAALGVKAVLVIE